MSSAFSLVSFGIAKNLACLVFSTSIVEDVFFGRIIVSFLDCDMQSRQCRFPAFPVSSSLVPSCAISTVVHGAMSDMSSYHTLEVFRSSFITFFPGPSSSFSLFNDHSTLS